MPDGPLLEARARPRIRSPGRELIRRYRALVFRCITKVAAKYDAVLSNEDANEIFGDMCFNLLRDDMRKLRAYDPARGAKLGSWLGLLAINTAYDYLRTNRRGARCSTASTARPSATRRRPERARRAAREGALGLPQRRCWPTSAPRIGASSSSTTAQGLLPEEVAAAMGISVKTVYSKKNKLRSKLLALADLDRDPHGDVAPRAQRPRLRHAA